MNGFNLDGPAGIPPLELRAIPETLRVAHEAIEARLRASMYDVNSVVAGLDIGASMNDLDVYLSDITVGHVRAAAHDYGEFRARVFGVALAMGMLMVEADRANRGTPA